MPCLKNVKIEISLSWPSSIKYFAHQQLAVKLCQKKVRSKRRKHSVDLYLRTYNHREGFSRAVGLTWAITEMGTHYR